MAYGLTKSANLVAASTQYFTAADSTSLSPTGTTLTIEAWVKFASVPANFDYWVMNKGGTGQRAWDFSVDSASSVVTLNADIVDNGGGASAPSVTWSPSPVAGVWYHIAFVYSGTSGIYYVDGKQMGATQTIVSRAIHDSTDVLIIGDYFTTNLFPFNGQMSLVRLWSTARTASEIATNRNQVLGTGTGLLGEWTLDNTLNDNSGNGNTLTNVNTATFVTDVPGPIVFDAFTAGVVAGTGTNQTFSHTTSGSDRLLVVLINQNGTDAVTGVTYNGVAMTQAIKKIRTLGTSEAYIYYLFNPALGTNTVSVSESSNPNQIDVDAISFMGAAQSGTPDTGFLQDQSTAAGGNFTATVNVSTANSWMVAMQISSAANATSSVNATLRSANYTKNSVEDSNAAVGSGNQTIGYGWPAATNGTTIIAMAFAPLAPAPSVVSVSDTSTISESITIATSALAFPISVNDTVTVTESVTVFIPTFKPGVFDTVTVSESISIAESAILLSIFDSVTVTESIVGMLVSYISVFDSVTITDVPAVRTVSSYSVFDSVTVSENMNINSIDNVMNPTSSWGLKILN